jgi:hypothetical protein
VNTWRKLHEELKVQKYFLPVTLVIEFTCEGKTLKLSVVGGSGGAGGYPLPALLLRTPRSSLN